MSLTVAGMTSSCFHPRFQNQTKEIQPQKTEQGSQTRILGTMPIQEARPIQLGMTLLFSDQQNRAYTAAMAPLINQAANKIRAKTSYHDIIEWIANKGASINTTLGFGFYRYDPRGHDPELITIFEDTFADQPFGTAVVRENRHYGLMIPFLESVKTRFAKPSAEPPSVQHVFSITINKQTRTVPGTRINFVTDPKEMFYARLVHADPAQRKKLGFQTDDDLRKWVRSYQDLLLGRLATADWETALKLCSEISYLEYTSVFFARGSSGNATAFLLACFKTQGTEFTAFKELPDFLAFGLPFDEFYEKLRSGEAFL